MVGLGIGIAVAGRRQWWPTGADYALDFANNRYMVDGVEVPASAAFSFSRGTPAAMADGQGNWRSFPAGSLRRINGIGALLEPAATNLVRASDDIGGPGWTPPPAQLTRSGNATDGWQFTVNSAYSGFLTLEQSFPTIAAGNTVHICFDLHESGLGKAALWTPVTGYAAFFDGMTGEVSGSNVSMKAVGGGWWRCKWQIALGGAMSAFRIRLGNSAIGSTYLEGQALGMRAPQVELARRSSYIANLSTSTEGSRDSDILNLLLPPDTHDVHLHQHKGAAIVVSASGPYAIDPAAFNESAMVQVWAFKT